MCVLSQAPATAATTSRAFRVVDNGTNKECAMETPRRFGVEFSAGSCQHAGFYGVVTASLNAFVLQKSMRP